MTERQGPSMRLPKVRRVTGVLAVTGVLLATTAGPALAEGVHEGNPVSVAFPDLDVPVGGSGVDPLGPNIWSTIGPTTLTEAKVTYHLTGLKNVHLTPSKDGGGDCTQPSPTRVTCTDPRDLSFEGETIELYLPVVVTAAKSATAGDTGQVTITFSAKGVAPITGTSKIRVTGDRSSLPVTGSTTALLGAIGVLLLGIGALGVLAARRRVRFVS
ncbi:LPXTG cell wall anchor domain-containing protein [Actinoplanes palleronii]|nr:LPXTG cell wall anchor domain-containing protein [Actinoplanes palleronii]